MEKHRRHKLAPQDDTAHDDEPRLSRPASRYDAKLYAPSDAAPPAGSVPTELSNALEVGRARVLAAVTADTTLSHRRDNMPSELHSLTLFATPAW
jgi:hypothetical protein